jgi:hypothetical protein
MEKNLLDKLICAKTESSHNVELVVNELNSNIKHVREVLQEAVAAKDPTNIDKVEVSEITNKLLAVQELPTHLVTSDGTSAECSVR